MKFKVGDKVRCMSMHSLHSFYDGKLTVDRIYTILTMHTYMDGQTWITVKENNGIRAYNIMHFNRSLVRRTLITVSLP